MTLRKSRLNIHVEKTENLVKYLFKKKRDNIQNSLVRPLYQEALKTLFLVIILLLDTLIPLEVYRLLIFPLNIVIPLMILCGFLYIEIRLYNSIWGKNGCWSIHKYKKSQEASMEEKKM